MGGFIKDSNGMNIYVFLAPSMTNNEIQAEIDAILYLMDVFFTTLFYEKILLYLLRLLGSNQRNKRGKC